MEPTAIIITGLFITVALYDLVLVVKNGVGCSVSRFMQRAGFKSPIFSVVLGMLLGHFWMYMPPESEPEAQSCPCGCAEPATLEPTPDPKFIEELR
jgi:hypothetical protein